MRSQNFIILISSRHSRKPPPNSRQWSSNDLRIQAGERIQIRSLLDPSVASLIAVAMNKKGKNGKHGCCTGLQGEGCFGVGIRRGNSLICLIGIRFLFAFTILHAGQWKVHRLPSWIKFLKGVMNFHPIKGKSAKTPLVRVVSTRDNCVWRAWRFNH